MKIIYSYSKHSVSILLLLCQKLGPFFDEKYFEELNFSFFEKAGVLNLQRFKHSFYAIKKYALNI